MDATPNTPAPAPAPAPQPPAAAPAAPVEPPKLVIPANVLDEKAYLAKAKAPGFKVHTRENHALKSYGSVDIVETTAASPGGAQVLAVVRYVKASTQPILDEIAPLLAEAKAKATPPIS